MRLSMWMVAVAYATATSSAQQPANGLAPRAATRADSATKPPADTAAIARERRRMQAANAQVPPPSPQGVGGAQGPTNPRMLPDFSAVGDLVGDLSEKGSTQADGARFSVREVELAVQAVVDPFFRGDVFLGISDVEKISIEQAFLTTTALPNGLQVQMGRFLMPVGKQNTTHRHDLHTVEYPWVIQKFLSDDGLKGTGVTLSKIFSPFGFYQELIVSAIDRFGDPVEGLKADEAVNKSLDGLGFSARFRNYVDISQNANFELSASAITGKRERATGVTSISGADTSNARLGRQSLLGADLTFRWKPLQQGLYKSFLLQAEVMHQVSERLAAPPGSLGAGGGYLPMSRDFTGGYVFARWQLSQRLFLGGRYDALQDPAAEGANFTAGSAFLEWFPSEFSKLTAQFERATPSQQPALNRILLQAAFAVGPHKPHPF
ncbi:MAG: hypothetical protein ACHQQ3_05545 [Gemmatimonadales bacterium]